MSFEKKYYLCRNIKYPLNMKKVLLASLLFAMALLLFGCNSSDTFEESSNIHDDVLMRCLLTLTENVFGGTSRWI